MSDFSMSSLMYPRFVSLLWLPLLLLGIPAGAQGDVVFTVNPAGQKAGLNDQFEITYTISGTENIVTMGPVGLKKDFVIVGGPYNQMEQGTSYSVTNGNTQRIQYTTVRQIYVVQARHTGTLTIPHAIAKDALGRSYQCSTAKVQIVPGSLRQQQAAQPSIAMRPMPDPNMQRGASRSAQMRPRPAICTAATQTNDLSKEIFLRAVCDKSKVHIGEQVTVAYKLYSRLPVLQADGNAEPRLNGFWKQDFPLPTPLPYEYETVNGKTFEVYTIKKCALFAQQTGNLVIDPLDIHCTVRLVQEVKSRAGMEADPQSQYWQNTGLTEGDLYGNPSPAYVYRDVDVDLKSVPLNVQVADVPEESRPAEYTGAVGRFTVTGKLSSNKITTDDAATYTLTITGRGNIKLFEAPGLKLPEGIETSEPLVIDTITGKNTDISGSKIITYTLSPKRAGNFTIPPVSFTYFNPQTGAYETIAAAGQKFTVTEGRLLSSEKVRGGKGLPADIHGNLPLLAATAGKPVLASPVYWGLYAVTLLGLLGLLIGLRHKDGKGFVAARNSRADTIAMKRLARAQSMMRGGQQKAFYDEVSRAIWLYLSDRLSIPISQLSKATAKDALSGSRVPTAVEMKLDNLVQDCETALYAPSGSSQQMQRTYQSAVSIISEMETFLHA